MSVSKGGIIGRPRKVIRPVQKNLAIPQDIVTRIDLLLFSDLEMRVPTGAWQTLVVNLLNEHLRKLEGNPDGGPG